MQPMRALFAELELKESECFYLEINSPEMASDHFNADKCLTCCFEPVDGAA